MPDSQYSAIPAELQKLGLFCLRIGKRPYSTDGRGAQPNNPETTFTTFDKALDAYNRRRDKYDGLGVSLSGNICGIDLDHAIDASGALSPLAEEVLETFPSYAEKSPSGRGLHILLLAPGFAFDKSRYFTKRSDIGLEVYGAWSPRYFTLTGDRLNDLGLGECGQQLTVLLDKYMTKKSTEVAPANTAAESQEQMDADELALTVADTMDRIHRSSKRLEIEGLLQGDSPSGDESADDLALCNHLAFYSQRNAQVIDAVFRESGRYREKWDEMRGALTYGEMTIRRAIVDCKTVWSPDYRSAPTREVQAALDFLKEIDLVNNPRYRRDDVGAGYLLADFVKPFARPTLEDRTWLAYTGTHWSESTGEPFVEESAKNIARALAVYASGLGDEAKMKEYLAWAGRWADRNNRQRFIKDALSVHPISRSSFDKDPWTMNVGNGILNLHTMELRPHDPDELLAQYTPVEYIPGAHCERWEKFIDEIMTPCGEEIPDGSDTDSVMREKADFLRRFLGYNLCGDTSAESFLIMYGPRSRNGKSVCTEAIKAVLGSYAKTASAETIIQAGKVKDPSSANDHIARLAGARSVSIGELQQGTRLDSAFVKLLTGGDSVTARHLHKGFFDFEPQFKLSIHSNYLPECSDLSIFNSGRVMVLPFSRHFAMEEQDRGLKYLFRQPENQSGILNWLIDGLVEYLKQGINPPGAVRRATAEYRRDSDKIARFMEDALEAGFDNEEKSSLVYAAYKRWCKLNGQYPENSKNFLHGLGRAGVRTERRRPVGGGEKTTLVVGYHLNDEYIDLAIDEDRYTNRGRSPQECA